MLLLEDTTNMLFLSSFTQFFAPVWLQVSVLSAWMSPGELSQCMWGQNENIFGRNRGWSLYLNDCRRAQLDSSWEGRNASLLLVFRRTDTKKNSQKTMFPVDWGSNDICSQGEVTARVSSERPLIHKTLSKLLRKGFYWGKGWAFLVWPLRCRTLTRLFA